MARSHDPLARRCPQGGNSMLRIRTSCHGGRPTRHCYRRRTAAWSCAWSVAVSVHDSLNAAGPIPPWWPASGRGAFVGSPPNTSNRQHVASCCRFTRLGNVWHAPWLSTFTVQATGCGQGCWHLCTTSRVSNGEICRPASGSLASTFRFRLEEAEPTVARLYGWPSYNRSVARGHSAANSAPVWCCWLRGTGSDAPGRAERNAALGTS